MRILLFAIVMFLFVGVLVPPAMINHVGVSAASAPFQQWQRYTVTGEEFSVALPALPAMDTNNEFIKALRKSRTMRLMGSYDDGVVYTIRTFENVQDQTLEQFIEQQRNSGSSNSQWKPTTDLSLNGSRGRHFEVVGPITMGATQVFQTKTHLYEFSATGAPFQDLRVQQFFKSITLGKKIQAIQLEDGIGAQPPEVASAPLIAGKNADRKAFLVIKPEPRYTEAARKEQIEGPVVLKVVFASTGAVTNIEVTAGQPLGLVDQAIRAAKQIRF